MSAAQNTPSQKKILLISERGDDQEFVTEIGRSQNVPFELFSNAKDAVQFMSTEKCSAIFVDITEPAQLRDFENNVQETLGMFSDQADPNHMHYMSDTDFSENRDVILSPIFGSFFQRPLGSFEEIARNYGRFALASETKNTHDLGHFLAPGNKLQKVLLTHTDQKQEAVEAVRQYLIKARVRPRVANLIANAVDELLMNAMFDAPSDEFGRNLYTSVERRESRALSEQEKVLMTIGFDGLNVGVSVGDRFGSVDRTRLLNHVTDSYRKKTYNIKVGQAGAGLGVANIFNTGGSLIYHCEAQVKTEATLLYRIYPSFREFKRQFKFFSAKFYQQL